MDHKDLGRFPALRGHVNLSVLVMFLVLPSIVACAATTEPSKHTIPVDSSSAAEASRPPASYALDQVRITLEQTVEGLPFEPVNGHPIMSLRRTIDGRNGAVQEIRRTAEGDSTLVTLLVLDDVALTRLLNDFYTAGFFGYCHDPNRLRGVELVGGTRRLTGTVRDFSDWTDSRLCIQIADYRRCESPMPGDPGPIFDLFRDLWDLGSPK